MNKIITMQVWHFVSTCTICWGKELHLKLLEIVFVKEQQLGNRQGPFIHDMLIYSPDP